MSDAFNKAVNFVLQWEGGLVDDPNDPGEVTKFGISKRSHPDIDVANLTEDDAKKIYKKEYWDKCRCDVLPEPVAFVVFDEAVNQGIHAAICDLQEACDAVVDGVMGPATVLAANTKDTRELVVEMTMVRLERYKRIVLARPEMGVFARGWKRRAATCLGGALNI